MTCCRLSPLKYQAQTAQVDSFKACQDALRISNPKRLRACRAQFQASSKFLFLRVPLRKTEPPFRDALQRRVDGAQMTERRTLALIAHDAKKDEMVAFAKLHESKLADYKLFATGTTGGRIQDACPSLDVERMKAARLVVTSRLAQ